MANNNATAFTPAASAAGAAPGGAAAVPPAQPQPQQRLPRGQQPDPPGAVAVRRFCARCAKRLAVEPTLVCKKVPGGGKCTRCTRNGSKCEKVSGLFCCVAVWLRSGVVKY